MYIKEESNEDVSDTPCKVNVLFFYWNIIITQESKEKNTSWLFHEFFIC